MSGAHNFAQLRTNITSLLVIQLTSLYVCTSGLHQTGIDDFTALLLLTVTGERVGGRQLLGGVYKLARPHVTPSLSRSKCVNSKVCLFIMKSDGLLMHTSCF